MMLLRSCIKLVWS